MKVILTGANGQLGREISRHKPKGLNLIAISRKDLDMNSYKDCCNLIDKERPDWVINTAAYTDVDNAEVEETKAFNVNALAPKAFSEKLLLNGGKLLQISTDYVFNGKQNYPYKTYQDTCPINTYGKSKEMAEKYIQDIFSNSHSSVILRTSWIIGKSGKNFANTIINLINKRDEINVIEDQVGCMTSTLSLAKVCWDILKKDMLRHKKGTTIFHWTEGGKASWYDIATTINNLSFQIGLTNKKAIINPISTSEFKTLAKRPSYSVLDCETTQNLLGYKPLHWSKSLEKILKDKDP